MLIADFYWARNTLKTAEKYILFCRQCAETRIAKKRYQEGAEAEEEDNPDVEARRPKLKLFPGRLQPFFQTLGM